MIEILKHILGLCGEGWHPNIFSAIISLPLIAPVVRYIKCKCKKCTNEVSSKDN